MPDDVDIDEQIILSITLRHTLDKIRVSKYEIYNVSRRNIKPNDKVCLDYLEAIKKELDEMNKIIQKIYE